MSHPTGFLLELVGFCETMTLAFEFDGFNIINIPIHFIEHTSSSKARGGEMR